MKKILALILAALMLLSVVALAEQQSTAETEGVQASEEFYANADFSIFAGKKIGITVQSLQNAYWAGVMTAVQEELEAAGADVTIVSCDDSSATQIGQIENFISAKCDLIMAHPSDAPAIEDAMAEARAAGIKTMCWDDPMENTDANWVLENTQLGRVIGELAADFINKYYSEDNKAQLIMIGYPQTTILLEREEGIMEALNANAAGKFEVVANQAGIDAIAAQTAVETTLQAHPNAKVVTGIGAGAMIGADEALNIATGGVIPEDMGVFTADVTMQQLEHLADETYPARAAVGFEGSDRATAHACACMFALILADNVGAQNVFRQIQPVWPEDVEAIMPGMM